MKYQAATQNSVDLLTMESTSMFKKKKHYIEQYRQNGPNFCHVCVERESGYTHPQKNTVEGRTPEYQQWFCFT